MDRANNGIDSPRILALEIEGDDEQESLIHETTMEDNINGGSNINNSSKEKDKTFFGRNAHGIRRRVFGDGDGIGYFDGSSASGVMTKIQGFVRSDLVSHAVYHLRNFTLLAVLAFFVLMVIDWEGFLLRSERMEHVEPNSPHTYSFGGKYNGGHNIDPMKPYSPAEKKSEEEEMEDLYEEIVRDAYETSSAWDLSTENFRNEEGNYLHDPMLSPFASDLYDATQEELDARQEKFSTRMDAIINEFGVWNNPTFAEARNLDEDFYDGYKFRDVVVEEFPDGAWQTDKDYITSFLDQAQALVEAMKEGIMQEYNHPNPDDIEKDLFGVIIGDHDFINGAAVHKETKKKQPGIAYLTQQSFDGLVKKLLHAMITTDYFYVVVAGPEETYRANNFAQTQVMQFNYLMEPVFHKLGMALISRNMGTSASTAVSALGGADIYGETDILWHVQDLVSEENTGEFDLLQKQTIMSGERIPIILSPMWDELVLASKGTAWVGNLQPGADVCQLTTMNVLPDAPACHSVNCDAQSWESGKCHVYDSVCWEPRFGYKPLTEQNEDVGFQKNSYPGFRRHQLEGRKMALLILHALTAALQLWRDNVEADSSVLPLAPQHWHVADDYIRIRESVMSLDRTPGEAVEIPACEQLMKSVDPRICHIPMRAYTEWTPRVVPDFYGLKGIVNNLIAGEVVSESADAYEGPDVRPLKWQIHDGELDVHMIAIAANVSGPGGWDDDAFEGEDDWYNSRNMRRLPRSKRRLRHRNNLPAPVSAPAPAESDLESYTGHKVEISEGSGWTLENAPIGFCDGSAQSRCNRSPGNKCLLSNHNHFRASLVGSTTNGWLTMRVPGVRHGIILARIEFDENLPDDFIFDFAVDGIATTMRKANLDKFEKKLLKDLTVYPLLVDAGASVAADSRGRDYDVAIRIRSNVKPDCQMRLSHIYYA